MAVLVREATLEDLPAVVHLRQRVSDEEIWISPSREEDKPRVLSGMAARLGDPAAAQFVAVVDHGGIVGFLTVKAEPYGVAELGMFVDDNHRGHGIGKQLLQACVDWASRDDSHVHKLTLQTWPHNERAIRLYRSFGFEVEGRMRRHYPHGGGLWDVLVMGLVLDFTAPDSPHPDAP